ncbi:hypothetical protein Acr_27g0008410 [Actinidia rufa]|uniref:HAUS augmin-like complex subunit 6 N-terminal domain-containing protein n=1 Tax=Actinidia rufa TaxID=165716 RepID=A0A7J0H7M1_9ERIC|nr:hypothetical protein Acr_27g0008410 [Actinidia rufa]
MTMDREKAREIELESAMYTNCLLLGLDPLIIGIGANNGTHRDFDKVWPIFDSAQSRDFRKVVQSIISELESQGSLPRSNSRVSSLATCCGPRFVEILWQLSLHALREVHRRTFAADVGSNPLPASLTDVAFSHAATLLPVTKARIAIERRRFLKNAEAAVQRQAIWSNLAHEMTAEFFAVFVLKRYKGNLSHYFWDYGYQMSLSFIWGFNFSYLLVWNSWNLGLFASSELEKLHDLRNKVKLEGELWDELVSSSSQNSHLVQRATRIWDSLLSRKSQHEVLASGPIEDLIAHREHRYRISGSSLLAAMDQSSQVHTEALSVQHGNLLDDKEERNGPHANVNKDKSNDDGLDSSLQNDEKISPRSGRVHPTVDIAEILRRWTHALQHIHKQSIQLSKANDGEGPELLRGAHDGSTSGHPESLEATLGEHRQHLTSIQVLINQLKDVGPAIQNSIMELTEEVNSISSKPPPPTKHHGRSTSSIQSQSSGRAMESSSDEVADVTSRLLTVQLEKVSASPPSLKLPPLFSVTPNSSGKGGNVQKRHTLAQTNQSDIMSERKSVDQPLSSSYINNAPQDSENSYTQNLKRSVREAALQSSNLESSEDNRSDDSSEHFFVPLSAAFTRLGPYKKLGTVRSKLLFQSQDITVEKHAPNDHAQRKYKELPHILTDLASLHEYDGVNDLLSATGSNCTVSDSQKSYYDMEEAQNQVFSPPLLMETTWMGKFYEDLLGMLVYRHFI